MELVSGPDVGGGLLLQLTREPADPLVRYTIHAQEGGIDAGEGPAASPASIGFVAATTGCSIGGRHCFHRTMEAPSDQEAKVRFAYNRLRFVLRPLLRQVGGQQPVPFDQGLATTLGRIVAPLRQAQVPWLVGGSAAPTLLGAAIRPHDLDIATTRDGVHLIADALADQLIEPVSRGSWGDAPPRWGARAFVGTFQDGLAVEWAEAIPDALAHGAHRFDWSVERLNHPIDARVGGWTVPVAPPEVAVVVAAVRGPAERLPALAALFRNRSPSWPLLDHLLDAAEATEVDRRRVTEVLPPRGG